MLIFNCTEAASKFFSRVHKGKTITPVEYNAPSPVIEDDEPDSSTEQWLVHAITVQRKNVLFVMHVKTRYCVILADAKKADVEGVVQRFADRWLNGVMVHAINHDLAQWIDADQMIEHFRSVCLSQQFYRRSHRSAQKHIDEIAWIFKERVAERGSLPPDEMAAMVFDEDMNDTPRSSKGAKDYYWPLEEMIVHWLRQYCALEEAEVEEAKKRRKQVRRESEALKREAWLEEYNRQNSIS
ncbi:hypothetical protein DBV33_21070 [Pseudomonas fluorescens]|nr:hypothetical protein DBV33_21070 [Pseudomonas fluorescens]